MLNVARHQNQVFDFEKFNENIHLTEDRQTDRHKGSRTDRKKRKEGKKERKKVRQTDRKKEKEGRKERMEERKLRIYEQYRI